MSLEIKHGILLTVLALVVATALTWAFIVLPYWVSDVLYDRFQEDAAGELSHGPQEEEVEPFIAAFHLRVIGYASLLVVVMLIVVGLLAERRGLAAAGR